MTRAHLINDLSGLVRSCNNIKTSEYVQRSYPPPEEIATPANAELLIDDILTSRQADVQREVCVICAAQSVTKLMCGVVLGKCATPA